MTYLTNSTKSLNKSHDIIKIVDSYDCANVARSNVRVCLPTLHKINVINYNEQCAVFYTIHVNHLSVNSLPAPCGIKCITSCPTSVLCNMGQSSSLPSLLVAFNVSSILGLPPFVCMYTYMHTVACKFEIPCISLV